jgi:hypothetical protein
MKLNKVLEIVNGWEATGKSFFIRNSNGDMRVILRDPQLWGGDPNVEHWANARDLLAEINSITNLTSDIKIDKMAGQLYFTIYKIYKEAP